MPTQSYRLTLDSRSPDLSVIRFSAEEAVNGVYRVAIELTSPDNALPISDYLCRMASLHSHFKCNIGN